MNKQAGKNHLKRTLCGTLAVTVLWLGLGAGARPAQGGQPLDKEYNLYFYSGWAGTVNNPGLWGYKRWDYIGGFTLVRSNVPARELEAPNGVAFSWPANTAVPAGKLLVSTVGIVAYPTDVDVSQIQWVIDPQGHTPPAGAGSCGRTHYLYVQRAVRTNGNDWVIGRATGTLFAVANRCSAGTTDGGCQSICGNATVKAGCVDLRIPLGAAADKADPHSGGNLMLYADRLTAGLGNRSALVYKQLFAESAVPVKTTNQLGRIEVNNGYVVAETTDDQDGLGYAVRVIKGGTEVSTTHVRQPSPEVLRVAFQSNTLGVWEKEFSETTLGGDTRAVALKEFSLGGQPLRTKVSAEWTNSPAEIVQAKATRNAQYQIIEQTQQVYTKQANGVWRNTQTIVGLGADAQTSFQQFDDQGRLTQSADHQGRWSRSTYAAAGDVTPAQVITPWENAAANAPANQCRVQDRSYTSSSTSNTLTTIETVTESVLGLPVSVTTDIRLFKPGWGAVLSSTNIVQTALGTYTTAVAYDSNGYPWKTTHPDGTTTINLRYSLNGTSAPFSNVLLQAEESFTGEVTGPTAAYRNGRRHLSLTDPKTGTLARQQSWEIRDGIALLTQDDRTLSLDSQWRVTTTATLTGTNTTTYSCCGVSQTVDAEGNRTDYTYDDLKRQVTVTRAGVTTSNVYDAADRVIATYRNGVLVSSSTYNTAGELTTTTDALGHTTSYSHTLNGDGTVTRTTTYPDQSTRVEISYRDGRLYQVTGTAVHGVRYGYRVEPVAGFGVLVTRETKLDGATEKEWTETWTDGAGRTLKTVRSGDVTTSQSFYNSKGQLWKQVDADTNTTLSAYNAAGEQIVTAVDMDRDDAIGANDRITSNATSIVTAHGTTVLRRETWQYSETGPVLVATRDTTGDGLRSWQTSFDLTSSSVTVINPATQTRTVTTTSPDGSTTVNVYREGRLLSTTRKDGAGSQLSVVSYQHDALGRVVTNSDTRTTTTYTYNAADQQTAVTVAGAGVTAQTTQFQYDTMGRRTVTTLPDGAQTRVSYLLTGEPSTNWGDRTYPVAYSYDYAGRMKTMTTWQDYAGNTGKAVTTWNYDPSTGQLASKRYQDNLGPDYTYTPAGRLARRTWARGVVTTYAYNNAGDLASVAYSDGTPSVTYTYDRRGRRLTATQDSGLGTQDAVSYSYSGAGQLLTETHTAGPLAGIVVTNSYDALLRRSSVAAQTSSLILHNSSFSYDNASRLSVVSAGTLSAAYAYVPNAPGLVNSIVFRTGGAPMMTTSKSYDGLNRLTNIVSRTGVSPVSSHTYELNAANQRTKRTDADGSYWDYGYDSLGQVTNAVRRWSDGALVAGQQYGYLFDDIGNRKTATLNSNVSEYTANLVNQYTQRTVPGYVDIIGSAANSATVTVGVSGVTNSLAGRQGDYFRQELALANTNAAAYGVVNIIASMDYNGTNVVVTNTGSAFLPKTPEQFTHDADGNLISDGRWQYTWDGENRLLSAESLTNAPVASKRKVEWTYDADGRRIRQKVYVWDVQSSVFSLQSSVLYAYDGWQCLAELNATNNAVVRSYVWGLDLSGSQTGAGGIGGLLFGTFNGSNSTSSVAYAFDGNGNVSALLDMKTGQIAAEYEYSPFGETIRATGPLAKENPFRFSTKRTDDTTGLIFYEYRILRPDIGRWLSRDPIEEEGGLLLYGFVYNDPINQVDPDGEIPLDTIWDIGNIIYDIAVGDDLSLAADVAALMIPYIPAGATKLVKAAKVADVAGVCANAKKLTVSYNYVHVSYHFPKGKDAAKNYVKWTQGGKKSLWTPGTTDAQVKGYIEKALGQAKAAGKLKPDEVKGVYDVGVEVGASNGKKVTKIKLQADSNGNIHAHPAD